MLIRAIKSSGIRGEIVEEGEEEEGAVFYIVILV